MFVLGIDPGLSRMGYGVLQAKDHTIEVVAVGVIRTEKNVVIGERLAELHRDLVKLIDEYRPVEAAIEQVFVNRNLQTATAVGRASGVILLALAQAGVPVEEYTPSAVKGALTGYGSADKQQVQRVVAMRLNLEVVPKPADAADALAIALCHLQTAPSRKLVGGAR